jgi:hypothetical protein
MLTYALAIILSYSTKRIPTMGSVIVTYIINSNDQLLHKYKHIFYNARRKKQKNVKIPKKL